MCSSHRWPLLWQRALSRWYWPNYRASTRSRQGVTGVPIGSAWSQTYTIEWEKQRRHSVVLACVMAWLGHFASMKKFVFFFARKEACFASATWQWMLTLDIVGLLYNEAQHDAKVAQTTLTYILTVHRNEVPVPDVSGFRSQTVES